MDTKSERSRSEESRPRQRDGRARAEQLAYPYFVKLDGEQLAAIW
jgi:hypothetical protein